MTRYRNKAIGMIVLSSRPLHYKIVRFSQPKFRTNRDSYRFNNLRCEVFDSKMHAWKQLKEVVLHESFLGFNPAVSACGSLHWLTLGCKTFAFHVKEETYSMISLPEAVRKNHHRKLVMLGEYEGNLALICKEDGERFMELWINENYDRETWRKKQRVNFEALTKELPYIILTGLGNASAALSNRINNLTLFNLEDGSSKSLRLEMGFDVVETFSFRSDFEPFADESVVGGLKRRPRTRELKPRKFFMIKLVEFFRFNPASKTTISNLFRSCLFIAKSFIDFNVPVVGPLDYDCHPQ